MQGCGLQRSCLRSDRRADLCLSNTQLRHFCAMLGLPYSALLAAADDVDIQFARSSGAGGQNVNKVCHAVC